MAGYEVKPQTLAAGRRSCGARRLDAHEFFKTERAGEPVVTLQAITSVVLPEGCCNCAADIAAAVAFRGPCAANGGLAVRAQDFRQVFVFHGLRRQPGEDICGPM